VTSISGACLHHSITLCERERRQRDYDLLLKVNDFSRLIERIEQVTISTALVLGAWGCGAFGNDAQRTAIDFRHALEQEYDGAFSEGVFAIADWSPERKFLGPFCNVFAANRNG